jgi:hypothetical protein
LNPYIYKFDTAGKMVDSISYPGDRLQSPRCVALDPVAKQFYVSSRVGPIYVMDFAGNLVKTLELTWEGIDILKYGLAWYPAQPDSMKLLIYALKNQNESYLLGYDPATGKIEMIKDMLAAVDRDTPLGIEVTPSIDGSKWVLVTAVSGLAGDRVVLWELDPNTNWITWGPKNGALAAGEDTTLTISLCADKMALGTYSVNIRYEFNAAPGEMVIPVTLTVWQEEVGVEGEVAEAPYEFGLGQNYPNPFNPVTRIAFTLDKPADVNLTVWDISGRKLATLVSEQRPEGRYNVDFDAAKLPAGVYLYRLTAGSQTVTRKMVLVK